MYRNTPSNGQGRIISWNTMFAPWYAKVIISYSPALDASSTGNLLSAAGQVAGIGRMRPECGGNFGMYHVAGEEEMQAILAGNMPQMKEELADYSVFLS
jgi:hypothetical protein